METCAHIHVYPPHTHIPDTHNQKMTSRTIGRSAAPGPLGVDFLSLFPAVLAQRLCGRGLWRLRPPAECLSLLRGRTTTGHHTPCLLCQPDRHSCCLQRDHPRCQRSPPLVWGNRCVGVPWPLASFFPDVSALVPFDTEIVPRNNI